MAALAVDHDGLIVSKIAQQVRRWSVNAELAEVGERWSIDPARNLAMI